jgi:hypothetical protein
MFDLSGHTAMVSVAKRIVDRRAPEIPAPGTPCTPTVCLDFLIGTFLSRECPPTLPRGGMFPSVPPDLAARFELLTMQDVRPPKTVALCEVSRSSERVGR